MANCIKVEEFWQGLLLIQNYNHGQHEWNTKKSPILSPLSPIRCCVRMINCLKFELQDLLHWKRRGLDPIFMNFLWCCIIFCPRLITHVTQMNANLNGEFDVRLVRVSIGGNTQRRLQLSVGRNHTHTRACSPVVS